MAKNNIRYEGRLINNNEQSGLKKARSGKGVLQLVVAEQFSSKNQSAPDKFKDANKGPDEYVNTYTRWHRINVFGDLTEGGPLHSLATDPDFNHGAILEISASYSTEEFTRRKDGVEVADDRESIFIDKAEDDAIYQTSVGIKTSPKGTYLSSSDGYQFPLWDGLSEPPAMGGAGGGKPPAPEYGDNEGF